MAIASMTAYARQVQQAAFGELVWELRSVNHRFLDVSLYLPDELGHTEMTVRDQLRKRLGRGKIMATLTYHQGEQAPFQLNLNPAVLQQLTSIAQTVNPHFAGLQTDFIKLLKWPGLLTVIEHQTDELVTAVHTLLSKALTEFIATRQREGEQLHIFIAAQLEQMEQELIKVKSQLPAAEEALRARLQQRLTELVVDVDSQRMQQEVLFYLQKTDITEEFQRLQAHIVEMKRVLLNGGVIGRRLDFLVQEMQREANTLGNKANDVIIQQAGLELKVLIEQIREQVQNIE